MEGRQLIEWSCYVPIMEKAFARHSEPKSE